MGLPHFEGIVLTSGEWRRGGQRKNLSSENTTRVMSKGFKCRLPRTESTPTRCRTSRQNFDLAKRFSIVNLGARAGLKHRAWRGEREEVKMREGREKEQVMKMMYLEKTQKKTPWHWEKVPLTH